MRTDIDDQRDAERMKALAIAEALEVRAARHEYHSLYSRGFAEASLSAHLAAELREVARLIRLGNLEGAEDE